MSRLMRKEQDNRWLTATVLAITFLLAAVLTGCVTKSAAREQARRAYLAGQRDAIARSTSVTFFGPVNNPVVPWTDGLTLARAILQAVYNSEKDPTVIIIRRSGEEIQVDPTRLLSGDDFPLKGGDMIELRLPPE
jgi:hypothetical protein